MLSIINKGTVISRLILFEAFGAKPLDGLRPESMWSLSTSVLTINVL
jgi:hypothetical protein